jgi:TonB family protein
MRFVLPFLLLASVPAPALAAGACAALDPELVECPAPRSPSVTGLTAGHVVVRLTVRMDGTVGSARIETASGHRAWAPAVLEAVRRWRYVPSAVVRSKVVPFDLALD